MHFPYWCSCWFQVFGMLTKPLIRHLMPHQSTTTSMLSDDNTPKSMHMPLLDGEQQDSFVEFSGSHHDVPRPDSLRGFLMRPARTVHHYWRQFDDAFMRPVFGGRGFVPFVPGSPIDRSTHDLSKPWEEIIETFKKTKKLHLPSYIVTHSLLVM